MIYPILLCGGSGTRLWPLSRKSYPKQFANLMGGNSLFQDSATRLSGAGFAAPVVVTGDPFRFIVTEQLAAIEQAPQAILIEPEGRNTAPAILAAAQFLARTDPDAVMLIAPSDHLIPDAAGFRDRVSAALPAALEGKLVTFGITPTSPKTAYGYLELAENGADAPVPVTRFVEKPCETRAQDMLDAGNYLWNSGLFLFTAAALLKAYQTHAPDLVTHVGAAVSAATCDLGFTRLDPDAWARAEDISIDYKIMERADNVVALPYDGAWSDLGDWEAVRAEMSPDADGNVCSDRAQAIDCTNTLLRSESEGLELVGIGLTDIIAIAMDDAVLVTNRNRTQEVRLAVDALKARGASQAVQLPRDYRPWGWYESLVVGPRFQVKRIVVNPGASLSLQSHHHRSEHWVVVEGTARITIDEDVRLISENQSVYIPLGAVHRMENPGKLPMVLIEVQTGSYLGEDDITRYDDVYARN